MFGASKQHFLIKQDVRVGPQTLGSQVKFKVITSVFFPQERARVVAAVTKKSKEEFSKKYPQKNSGLFLFSSRLCFYDLSAPHGIQLR